MPGICKLSSVEIHCGREHAIQPQNFSASLRSHQNLCETPQEALVRSGEAVFVKHGEIHRVS